MCSGNEKKCSVDEKLDVAFKIYQDIFHQIQFADTKAGLALAWHGASLGFLFKLVIDNLKNINSPILECLTLIFVACSLVFAAISIGFIFSVIIPRLKDTSCSNKECMIWIYHISCEGFEKDTQRFIKNLGDCENILECLSRSIVAIAEILKKKYENFKWSLIFLAIAFIFEVITIIALIISLTV